MAVLKSTNIQGALCVNGVAVGGGKDFKYACFTASGNFTPTQGLVDGDGVVEAFMVAGGGGGGSVKAKGCSVSGCIYGMGGGGGAGEVIHHTFDITATTDCALVIGAGGQSGSTDGTLTFGNAGTNVGATRGGNTTGFGEIAYGGGAGGSRGCMKGGSATFTCTDLVLGGPAAGLGALVQNTCSTPAFDSGYGGYNGASSNFSQVGDGDISTQTQKCYGTITVSGSRLNGAFSGSGLVCSFRNKNAPGLATVIPGSSNFVAGGGSGQYCNRAPELKNTGRGFRLKVSCPFKMDNYFGFGGDGGRIQTSQGTGTALVCSCNAGAQAESPGSSGLVILKWFE